MTSPTSRRNTLAICHGKNEGTLVERTLDMNLFTPDLLKTEEGLRHALQALDQVWWDDSVYPLELTTRKLMGGPPYLFEYMVATIWDDDKYRHFLSMMQLKFPSSAKDFSASFAAALLDRLRDFYIRLLSPDVPRSLDERHRSVSVWSKALHALNDITFDNEPVLKRHSGEMEGVRSRQPQRKAKHAKRQSRFDFAIDTASFKATGVSVPCTKDEADGLATEILGDMEHALEEYLRVLRCPPLTSIVEELYIHAKKTATPELVAPNRATAEGPPIDIVSSPQDSALAYPHIQPLKAAKYFAEPAEGFGPWHLLLSSRAIQHLKDCHRDQNVWSIVKKKLKDLSDGLFSDSNQKRLVGSGQDIPIYEAKLTRDLRIIYQIDIAPEDITRNDHQVLKIWGIHTHAQIDKRLWGSISQQQAIYGKEYRRRCLHRETPRSHNKVTLPGTWSTAVEKLPTETAGDKSLSSEEQLELHSILTLEKFTRMSQALMNSIIAGQDATYRFEITGPEQEIVDHDSSCFVLGRSGTGKTTTMVFKMVCRELFGLQEAAEHVDTRPWPKYRQLFVTKSRILVGRVQEYFVKMMLSQEAGHKTPQELERLAQRNQRIPDEDILVNNDDEDDERPDLPKKFSELEDGHFPLFLTMDQLCKLLEADYDLSFKRRPRTKEHRLAEQKSYSMEVDGDLDLLDEGNLARDNDIVEASPSQIKLKENASIITFEIFLYAYWPRFPQLLTKNLDPALVYNELMGVIKGSEESIATDTNFLDKETYLNFSDRRQSTFASQRERIYQLFERYIDLKRERGDYDVADRTHAILRAMDGKVPGGRKVDFLYIDEAQDNLLIDACLLRLVCRNPHGLFWAGDTAQTISMGSSFRFDDLKALLYRIEARSSGPRAPIHPSSFHLAVNYRSHAGVVNCAHSIVDLITQFFPNSLDSLPPEQGLVEGPRPVFFWGWKTDVARYEQFLFHESGNIEFGAQQCILVRNDQARERLRQHLGEVGLVMTLYESKGLEFNDVLLFDFFHDSTASLAEWRVLLNMVAEAKRHNVGVPRFDETRHSSICSELKSLYVGITRARSNVWILDRSERGEPMRLFWESRNLIQMCRPGDPVPDLAVRSSPEQWAQQGRALFKTQHYQQSMFCFERAGLRLEQSIAYAYLLRKSAQRMSLQNEKRTAKNEAYIRAAESFVVCAGLSSKTPAKRLTYFGLGADCFLTAGSHAPAAQAYVGAENFTSAAQQFKRAGLFDAVADIILLHAAGVDPKVTEQCRDIALLHFHREGQLQKAVPLFKTVDDHLSYLGEYGFVTAHTDLLEGLGRWGDAAELFYKEGRHLDAIRLWLHAGDQSSKQRAGDCLLDSLWRTLPLGALPDEQEGVQKKLFEHLRTFDAAVLDPTQRTECAVFLAIFARDNAQLLELAQVCRHKAEEHTVALLCFDHALVKPPQMQNDDARMVSRCLESYDSYAQLMRRVILDWEKSKASYLLGFIKVDDESTVGSVEYHVLPSSILYEYAMNDSASSQLTGDHVTIDPHRLSEIIRAVLGKRMKRMVIEEHEACLQTKAFIPCINFAVSGHCGRAECRREHVPRESFGVAEFNQRIRLHMQQILIVQNMTLRPDDDRYRLQRFWQERLYDALLPTYYALGHVSALLHSAVPELQRASRALSEWIHHRFYSLRPYREWAEDGFLTDIVQTATLAFALDRDNAAHYTWRANCMAYPPPYLQREDGYVVHDLLHFLEASSESSVICGTLFIKHVLDQRIPIDMNTLLNLLESVFGRAILVSRSWDQLALPRSWILTLLSQWDERCRTQRGAIIRVLFQPLKDLLEAVYTNEGVGHLVYERRSLSKLPQHAIVRGVLIFRICKCLALVGYNINNLHLRQDIRAILTSLYKPGRLFSSLVIPYVKAQDWLALARAVRISAVSPIDEMVVLRKNESTRNIHQHPRELKIVRFQHKSDILRSLAYTTASKFNPEAKPFIPSAEFLTQHAASSVPDSETVDEPVADEPFNDGVDDIRVAPKDLSVQRTQTEVNAAKTIQLWYRQQVMAKASREGTSEATARIYDCARAAAERLQVPPIYRRLFLGPLPHVLAALQGCKQAATKTKTKLKKCWVSSTGGNLDKEQELFSKCRRLYNDHIRLWKELEPTSQLHREGSFEKLKQQVKQVNDLVTTALEVAPDIMEMYKQDMELGYKGIARVAVISFPTQKAPKKPSLNIEDIDL